VMMWNDGTLISILSAMRTDGMSGKTWGGIVND